MHIEILVEDASGELLIQALLPKLLGEAGNPHTWRTHAYKGIGRIPKDLRGTTDPGKRILLDRLPKVLAGYGQSLAGLDSAVMVVADVDDRDCLEFKRELLHILKQCNPRPRVLFRLAIEEIEAWLLGDRNAIMKQFPRARVGVLNSYVQDSICGTWERLADAVFPGGAAALKSGSGSGIGAEKCRWASSIGGNLDAKANLSPSFHAFRKGLEKLCQGA